MKLLGTFLGILGGISTILYIVEYLRPSQQPIIPNLGGEFYMYLAGLLFLGAITCFVGSKNSSVD